MTRQEAHSRLMYQCMNPPDVSTFLDAYSRYLPLWGDSELLDNYLTWVERWDGTIVVRAAMHTPDQRSRRQ